MTRTTRMVLVLTVLAALIVLPVTTAAASTGYWYPTWRSQQWSWYLYRNLWTPTSPSQPAPAPTQPAPTQPPAAPAPAPAPAPIPAPVPAPSGLNADEQYILQRVNQERAAAGLAALQIDMRLVATARAKSQDMITHNYFGHQSPTMGSPFDQLRRAGITYRTAGENLAGTSSAERAMQLWMQSPGHRANIMNPSYTHIGIGTVSGGAYGKMHTQHFIGR